MVNFKDYLTESKKVSLLKEMFIKTQNLKDIPQGIERDKAILRLSIVAELDAVSLYEAMAKMTVDENIKEILLDITNEEKEHIGEFESLLEYIDPDHEKFEEAGEEEAEELTGLDL
jgi:rubrerythrin